MTPRGLRERSHSICETTARPCGGWHGSGVCSGPGVCSATTRSTGSARPSRQLWSSVDTWSRRRRLDQVATLFYSLTSDVLTLTIRDEAGWLPDLRDLDPSLASTALAEARFDEVIADEANHSLKLVKRFAAL